MFFIYNSSGFVIILFRRRTLTMFVADKLEVRPVSLGSNAIEIAFGMCFGPHKVSTPPRITTFVHRFPRLYEAVRVFMTENERFKTLEEVVYDLNERWISEKHYFEHLPKVESFSRTQHGVARNLVIKKWFSHGRRIPEKKVEHPLDRVVFPVWKDKHHRLSRCYGGSGGSNLSHVKRCEHVAYHFIFDHNSRPMLPEDLAEKVGIKYSCMRALFSVGGRFRSHNEQLAFANQIWAPGGYAFTEGPVIHVQ